jgi:hypothetical protein
MDLGFNTFSFVPEFVTDTNSIEAVTFDLCLKRQGILVGGG